MYPVYRGVPRQYGHGLGSIFKSALKTTAPFVKPLVQKAIKTIKRVGLRQGLAAAKDIMLLGKSPKQVLKSQGERAIKSVGKATALSLGQSLIKSIKGTQPKSRRQSSVRRRRRKVVQRGRGKKLRSQRKFRHSRPLDIFD